MLGKQVEKRICRQCKKTQILTFTKDSWSPFMGGKMGLWSPRAGGPETRTFAYKCPACKTQMQTKVEFPPIWSADLEKVEVE